MTLCVCGCPATVHEADKWLRLNGPPTDVVLRLTGRCQRCDCNFFQAPKPEPESVEQVISRAFQCGQNGCVRKHGHRGFHTTVEQVALIQDGLESALNVPAPGVKGTDWDWKAVALAKPDGRDRSLM